MADEAPEERRSGGVFSRWFWLNYLVALLITLPVPLVNIEVNGELARRVPIYECYVGLAQGNFHKWNLICAAVHLGMCFAITAVVWGLIMRRK